MPGSAPMQTDGPGLSGFFPNTVEVQDDPVVAPPGYAPNKKSTELLSGWYYGVKVPAGQFGTVAGMCHPWKVLDKKKLAGARKLQKAQEKIWAKKNVCLPKKRVCVKPYSYAPKKSACSCM